jgi:hypothetical protein
MSHLDLPRYTTSQSRISLAQSGYGGYENGIEMSQAANLPADEVIHQEIRDILSTSDLMTVTKKSVKAELERRYVANAHYSWQSLTDMQVPMRSYTQEAVHWPVSRSTARQRHPLAIFIV